MASRSKRGMSCRFYLTFLWLMLLLVGSLGLVGDGSPTLRALFWSTLGAGVLLVLTAWVLRLIPSGNAKTTGYDENRAIPPDVRQAVLDRDDYICRYCGRRSQTMEVDHVIPVSQGGTSTLGNLVTACRDCNRKKAGRTPEEAGMEVLPVRTRRRNWE